MSYDWIREEWAAARRDAEHRPHPAGCTCQGCARAEADPERADRTTCATPSRSLDDG